MLLEQEYSYPKCTTCSKLKVKPVTNRFVGDNDYICFELNARTVTMNAITGNQPDELICISILSPELFGCPFHSLFKGTLNE